MSKEEASKEEAFLLLTMVQVSPQLHNVKCVHNTDHATYYKCTVRNENQPHRISWLGWQQSSPGNFGSDPPQYLVASPPLDASTYMVLIPVH